MADKSKSGTQLNIKVRGPNHEANKLICKAKEQAGKTHKRQRAKGINGRDDC